MTAWASRSTRAFRSSPATYLWATAPTTRRPGLLAYVLSLGPLAANSFQARRVPDCGHRFSGGANSRALVKAFYWMLGYDETFPNPENAPQLYE